MKKYLLLASVAGCLMAGNAMAGSFDDSNATINVKANILTGCVFTNVSDMDFKDIMLQPGDGNEAELVMTAAGVVSSSSENVISFTEDATAGSFTVSCPAGLSATANVGCAEGEGYDEGSGVCSWKIGGKSVSFTPGMSSDEITGTATKTFGGTLKIVDNIGVVTIDEPIIEVTLSY